MDTRHEKDAGAVWLQCWMWWPSTAVAKHGISWNTCSKEVTFTFGLHCIHSILDDVLCTFRGIFIVHLDEWSKLMARP